VRKLTSSCGTPSSQGVTNFRSRGPGAVMRRAVTQALSAVNEVAAADAPNASPFPVRPFAPCLLLASPRYGYGTRTPSIRASYGRRAKTKFKRREVGRVRKVREGQCNDFSGL
jgi:hypothetical protein